MAIETRASRPRASNVPTMSSVITAPTPAELALALAEAKTSVVAARPEVQGALVIGCDSVLDLDGHNVEAVCHLPE